MKRGAALLVCGHTEESAGLMGNLKGGRITGSRLTRHHETVLQRRQQVRVRLGVHQVLLDQIKHLAGTFSFYMDLRGSDNTSHA